MIRAFARLLGLFALAFGFAAAVIDGTQSLANGHILFMSLSKTGLDLAPHSFAFLKTLSMSDSWISVGLTYFFLIPTSVFFMSIGFLFLHWGRARFPLFESRE